MLPPADAFRNYLSAVELRCQVQGDAPPDVVRSVGGLRGDRVTPVPVGLAPTDRWSHWERRAFNVARGSTAVAVACAAGFVGASLMPDNPYAGFPDEPSAVLDGTTLLGVPAFLSGFVALLGEQRYKLLRASGGALNAAIINERNAYWQLCRSLTPAGERTVMIDAGTAIKGLFDAIGGDRQFARFDERALKIVSGGASVYPYLVHALSGSGHGRRWAMEQQLRVMLLRPQPRGKHVSEEVNGFVVASRQRVALQRGVPLQYVTADMVAHTPPRVFDYRRGSAGMMKLSDLAHVIGDAAREVAYLSAAIGVGGMTTGHGAVALSGVGAAAVSQVSARPATRLGDHLAARSTTAGAVMAQLNGEMTSAASMIGAINDHRWNVGLSMHNAFTTEGRMALQDEAEAARALTDPGMARAGLERTTLEAFAEIVDLIVRELPTAAVPAVERSLLAR